MIGIQIAHATGNVQNFELRDGEVYGQFRRTVRGNDLGPIGPEAGPYSVSELYDAILDALCNGAQVQPGHW